MKHDHVYIFQHRRTMQALPKVLLGNTNGYVSNLFTLSRFPLTEKLQDAIWVHRKTAPICESFKKYLPLDFTGLSFVRSIFRSLEQIHYFAQYSFEGRKLFD